ncbi:glycosyl transferase, group 2 family protein [Synechococcus sp. PCC 7335]|uniref:glycosyltransferase family 2 protein n=1 Tax=Synechococcus sp. (strain ATCC 29403 / PCC 7335) TaxID=91464 RepID=UPI00017EC046|nr:glycosyltransferase family 2 protein [Synechococcus sp. PCC 7335]EDX86660.1 glycosyl transferase, group 2 family protein [Synechococcus sp. PCC 7335]
MRLPEISVILPAYNTEKYIGRAIASALNQSISNIEIIVVDDGSTDNTVSVIQQIQAQDERLKLLINEQNMGVSKTRNRALAAAQGDWIAVLDSDDWYDQKRLEKILWVAKAENADIVADDLHLIRDGENSPWSTLLCQGKAQFSSLKQISPVYFLETDTYGQPGLHLGYSKPLFKKSFLTEHNIWYDPTLRNAGDFWFLLDCLVHKARFCLIPEPYYYYRSRPNSLIRQSSLERLENELATTHNFLEKEVVKDSPPLVRALLNNAKVLTRYRNYYSVVEPLKQKDFRSAVTEAIKYPSFITHLVSRTPGILYRRWRRAIFKTDLWEGIS